MMRNAHYWRCLAAVLAVPIPSLVSFSHAEAPAAEAVSDLHTFKFHQSNVLGTSLDLKLVAPTQADADACEKTILHEIERLRAILSTYDPQSEISKFQAAVPATSVKVSEDLHAVLLDYQLWRGKSAGAFSPQLGELLDFWTAAEKKGTLPTNEELVPFIAKLKQTAYAASNSDNTVRRVTSQPLNVDSLGKGYIVQKAAHEAKLKHPNVSGILLNIGGDITALGSSSPPDVKAAKPWEIKITNPQNPADNAPAIATVRLTDKAIATSGVYERCFTFGDKKLSHLLNPLTGRPSSNEVLSATVIAPDCATANALAAILSVLPEKLGMSLVDRTPGASAFLVFEGGKQARSKDFSSYETNPPVASADPIGKPDEKPPISPKPDGDSAKPASGTPWPSGFVLAMDLKLLPAARSPSAPYAAVWVEDANGRCMKILAAWVGNKRYLGSLMTFSKAAQSDAEDFAAMTRATRRSGEYVLTWDGKDGTGAAVPTGEYTLCIEVDYWRTGHNFQKLPVTCGSAKVSNSIPSTPFWDKIPVIFGPAH